MHDWICWSVMPASLPPILSQTGLAVAAARPQAPTAVLRRPQRSGVQTRPIAG
jgi:hypothetical protein